MTDRLLVLGGAVEEKALAGRNSVGVATSREAEDAPSPEMDTGSEPQFGEELLTGARQRSRQALTIAAGRNTERPRLGIRPAVAVAASVLVLALGGLVAWRAWPHSTTVVVSTTPTPSIEESGPADADAEQSGSQSAEVVVHVVGQVHAPGVVHLPAGARIADAIEAAGGATELADLTAVNLAREVADGEQVVVLTPGEAAAGGGQTTDGRVDVNSADAAALEDLPGIGPVLAQRIVAWREQHGRFTSVDQLAEVTGIGPAVLAGLSDLVRV